ncbi:MAG: dockerin type I repeat-containing protein [Planctomycetota bacterium]
MRRIAALCMFAALPCTTVVGQTFNFIGPNGVLGYPPASGVGNTLVSVYIHESLTGGPPTNVAGWSMALLHDPSLISVVSVGLGAYLQTVNNGGPPDFFSTNLHATGFAASAVYDFFGATVCTYEIPKEVLVVNYATNAMTLAGDVDGEVTTVVFGTIGNPPVKNLVVAGAVGYPVNQVAGVLTLVSIANFIRGDANGDGATEPLPDAIALLDYLFGMTPIGCLAAGDVNGDGSVNLLDPVVLLNWGFAGGAPPPAPFPSCGLAVSPSPFSCPATPCP